MIGNDQELKQSTPLPTLTIKMERRTHTQIDRNHERLINVHESTHTQIDKRSRKNTHTN